MVGAWGKGSRGLLAGAGSPEHPVLAVARRSRAEQLGRGGRVRGKLAAAAELLRSEAARRAWGGRVQGGGLRRLAEEEKLQGRRGVRLGHVGVLEEIGRGRFLPWLEVEGRKGR